MGEQLNIHDGVTSGKDLYSVYLNTHILPPQTQEQKKDISFSRFHNEV